MAIDKTKETAAENKTVQDAAETDTQNVLDLERFRSEVGETETASEVKKVVTVNPKIEPLAYEISALLALAIAPLSMALPSLKDIYTEQTISALSYSMAAVCVKHQWLENGINSKYSEEIALAAVAVPLGFGTYQAVKGDIAAIKEKNAKNDAGNQSQGVLNTSVDATA